MNARIAGFPCHARRLILCAALAIDLTACGGGEPPAFAPGPAAAILASDVVRSATPSVDDLDPGSDAAVTPALSTLCNRLVGAGRIVGIVSTVQDGDSITVNDTRIRLDSIDAPEFTQAYGRQSRLALSALVLGKPVTVAYSKIDRYGRIVGAVFTSACQYVNLSQVASGSAWFYRAYQCEISAASRSDFAAAEDTARAQGLGLWAAVAIAPWVYRNGVDANVPSCQP